MKLPIREKKKKPESKRLGDRGEEIAAAFLARKKYRILQKNFRSRFGEVDLIALDGKVLVFVEIKTRFGDPYGSAVEAINKWKLSRIIKAGQFYKLIHPEAGESQRVDVIAIDIRFDGKFEITHIPNITL